MFTVLKAQRTERIKESDFDQDPRMEQGWEIIARKGGFVYIGFNRELFDRIEAERIAALSA